MRHQATAWCVGDLEGAAHVPSGHTLAASKRRTTHTKATTVDVQDAGHVTAVVHVLHCLDSGWVGRDRSPGTMPCGSIPLATSCVRHRGSQHDNPIAPAMTSSVDTCFLRGVPLAHRLLRQWWTVLRLLSVSLPLACFSRTASMHDRNSDGNCAALVAWPVHAVGRVRSLCCVRVEPAVRATRVRLRAAEPSRQGRRRGLRPRSLQQPVVVSRASFNRHTELLRCAPAREKAYRVPAPCRPLGVDGSLTGSGGPVAAHTAHPVVTPGAHWCP